MSDLRIPRVIHRVWLGGRPMPEEFVRYGESWLEKNPGWQLRTWSEPDLADLINQAAFEAAPTYSEKSDFARYEILLRHGGIYVDTDVECLRPLEPLIGDADAFAGFEDDRLGTAIIGARPGHPFIAEVVRRIAPSFWANVDSTNASLKVGPMFLQTVFDSYEPATPDDGLTTFAPAAFYPYHYTEKHRRDEVFPDAFAVHHWAASWVPQERHVDALLVFDATMPDDGLRALSTAVCALDGTGWGLTVVLADGEVTSLLIDAIEVICDATPAVDVELITARESGDITSVGVLLSGADQEIVSAVATLGGKLAAL